MSLRIIGAGGHGKVVADIADAMGIKDIALLDDRFPVLTQAGRFSVVGKSDDLACSQRFCAIGSNATRERVYNKLGLTDSPVLIHPSVVLSPSATLGSGSLGAAGVIINADTVIGNGVILNTSCSIDHDCFLGDFVHISPGARLAGGVAVGPRSWIGIGAVICEGITIGADVMVAAGAAVVNDIPAGARVGGVPAKKI